MRWTIPIAYGDKHPYEQGRGQANECALLALIEQNISPSRAEQHAQRRKNVPESRTSRIFRVLSRRWSLLFSMRIRPSPRKFVLKL